MTRSTRQGIWCMGTLEQRLCVVGSRESAQFARNGFTLVELLVVVGIIAVLAAIITPAIFQARIAAQNAAIRAEIDLLTMGMMNYKNRFGSYPPCSSNCEPNGDLTARNHVARLFPRCDTRCDTLPNGSARPGFPQSPTVQDQFHVILNNNNEDDDGDGTVDEIDENFYNQISPLDSLLFWLGGYSSNPANPLQSGGVREKLYDEDASRVEKKSKAYHPAGKPNSPFIYIDSSNYGSTFQFSDFAGMIQIPGGPYAAEVDSSGAFHNPGKFQILNAGLDEQWGTDDDLSNFWKGTRGDQE